MPLPAQGTVNNLYNIIHGFINARTDATLLAQARRLIAINYTTLAHRNIEMKNISFRVRNDVGIQTYEVDIKDYFTPSLMSMNCTCNEVALCKHKVASLLFIAERLPDSQVALPPELTSVRNAHKPMPMIEVIVNMPAINLEVMNTLINRYDITAATSLVNYKKVTILRAENQEVDAEVNSVQAIYKVLIRKKSETAFHTYCNCLKEGPAICEHRYAVFYWLLAQKGKFYFESLKDFTQLKNELLSEYGYTLKDTITDKFDFVISATTGRPELKLIDPTLKKLSKYENWDTIISQLQLKEEHPETAEVQFPEIKYKEGFGIGFAINFTLNHFPYFTLLPFTAKLSKDESGAIHSFKTFSYTDPPLDVPLDGDTRQILHLLQEISNEQLIKLSDKENYFRKRGKNDMFGYIPFNPTEIDQMHKYIHSHMLQLFPLLENEPYAYQQTMPGTLSAYSLTKTKFSTAKFKIAFKLEIFAETTELVVGIKKEDDEFLSNIKFFADLFMVENEVVHLLNRSRDAAVIKYIGKPGRIKVNKKDTKNFLHSFVLPLQRFYDVEMPESISNFTFKNEDTTFTKLIYLSEKNDQFLVIRPAFRYNEHPPVEYSDATRIVEELDGKVMITQREHEVENAFVENIRALHPSFITQGLQGFYYISFEDAMKDGWFFTFYNQMKDEEAEVYGMKDMKKFHYNPHTPTITFGFKTGIDWFDVKINIMFGDQSVRLKDLRKAVINNRNYILLDDGSMGILPEEWAKKYSLLFKMGNVEKEDLKVPKFHFSLIDEMYDQIDDEKIRKELEYKRTMLSKFSRIEDIAMPEKVNALLRPYQKSGFSWFNFLDEFNWGGILADDMGLGKTLQTLTFIQHLKNKKHFTFEEAEIAPEDQQSDTHLIICPNSLMFNWENEIEKFCPDLTYHIHHGSDRITDATEFAAYDIIITTYGTIRSDFEVFVKFNFRYIILDESQAIKNPASKATKAVQLLKSRNRLALSGTPLQNNIYDLYAQLNFLNPGMLGNMEFFKSEFANPIEKHQEQFKKDQLKKLIFPFFLRRTKEQVATELPEKTETVLYCEMGEEQRRVYDAYRNDYRDRIMRRIATDGLEKSGIYVLQGLMKLRQVCDSPDILGGEEIYSHESVKLEELTREITENTGDHKVLVFSQFIGMLRLIKQRMELHGINYAYLDGQSNDRRESVDRFQTDETCKVFLISLKAGGVGLNLTAADYVYLVDPWWNPAVEQQAIDRTHRIGQIRSVFAYKMICKNTIEEKILILQNKKKDLARELITEEKSFLKNLNKEDIEYLFS
ncbi:MAG: SNF2-related protein [Bacteroidota bacterium]